MEKKPMSSEEILKVYREILEETQKTIEKSLGNDFSPYDTERVASQLFNYWYQENKK